MTRRRWMADEVSGNTAALVGEHAAHLARVLRAEVGQEFDIAERWEGNRYDGAYAYGSALKVHY